MAFIDLLYNLALLVALSVVSGFIEHRWKKTTFQGELLQGILFGSASVLGMARPLVFAPGLIFDGRSVMLSLCGLFFGLKATLISSGMAVAFRLYQGGSGASVGIMVISSSALIGLMYGIRRRGSLADVKALNLYVFGLIVHAIMLLLMLSLPYDVAMKVLGVVGVPIMVMYPLATVLIGKLLSDQEKSIRDVRSLQESEERFKLSMEATRDGLWDWNIDTGEGYFSPGYFAMLKYAPDQFPHLSKNWINLMHPEDRERVEKINQDCIDGRSDSFEVEFRMRTQTNEWRWILGRGKCVARNSNGKARRLIGTHFDITERKIFTQQVEASFLALKQSEEKIRLLTDNISDVLWIMNLVTGKWDYLSPSVERLRGFSVSEVLAQRMDQVMTPESYALVQKHLPERISQVQQNPNEPHHYIDEIEQTCKDGSTVWTEVSNRFLFNEKGELTLLGVSRNIQQRKLIEAQMHASQKALIASEERNRALLQAIPDLMFVFDRQGVFRDYHTADAQKLLIPPDQFLGKTPREALSPELAEITLSHLNDLFRTGKNQFYEYALTSGSKKHFYEGRMVLCGQETALAIVRDITEKKESDEERRQLEQQMQQSQKLESLGVLAGGVAHDFNNILMAILGNAELAIGEAPADSRLQENLDQIVVATNRAAELCRQMLAYSGKATFVIESVSLASVIGEMAHLLNASISKKAALHLNLAEQIPSIQADPSQIRQIVMNLVTNASDAIGEKGGEITLSAGTTNCSEEYLKKSEWPGSVSPGMYVFLEVNDTGCGMDEVTRKRMFEPFFSTKFTGRGLGLAAVLGIVRAHQGAIRVESEPGKGTSFRVLLPIPEKKAGSLSVSPFATKKWRGSGTILLADDEENLRALTGTILQSLGFQVLFAADGQEAIDLYKQQSRSITLVILDLTMPRRDGTEAFDELVKWNPEVRVIIASGYSAEDVKSRFPEKALAGVLQKPYSTAQLRNLLASIFPVSNN